MSARLHNGQPDGEGSGPVGVSLTLSLSSTLKRSEREKGSCSNPRPFTGRLIWPFIIKQPIKYPCHASGSAPSKRTHAEHPGTTPNSVPADAVQRQIQLTGKNMSISPILLISQSLTDKQQQCTPTYSHSYSSNAHTYTSTPTQTHMHSTSKHNCLLGNCGPLKRASSYSKPRLAGGAAQEPFTILIHGRERRVSDLGDDWEHSS